MVIINIQGDVSTFSFSSSHLNLTWKLFFFNVKFSFWVSLANSLSPSRCWWRRNNSFIPLCEFTEWGDHLWPGMVPHDYYWMFSSIFYIHLGYAHCLSLAADCYAGTCITLFPLSSLSPWLKMCLNNWFWTEPGT